MSLARIGSDTLTDMVDESNREMLCMMRRVFGEVRESGVVVCGLPKTETPPLTRL